MHEGSQAAIDDRCVSCNQPLRLGARFCSYCGFASTVRPAAWPASRRQATAFAPRGREIARVAGLFGLLLCCSLASIIAARHSSSPWPIVLLRCIHAVVVLILVCVRRH